MRLRLACVLAMMIAAGCEDEDGTGPGSDAGGVCATPCSEGAMCPLGFGCSPVGCCTCTVIAETCDGVDSDCDLVPDDGLEMMCACAPGGPGPGAESCNGVDDDCNGMIDDGLGCM